MAAPTDGGSVHGEMQIWYSTNLRALVESGQPFVAPEGSVAIKKQWATSGVVSYNIQVKLAEGASPDGLDWHWEQRNEAEDITGSGALPFCSGCHEDYPDTDYLLGTEFR